MIVLWLEIVKHMIAKDKRSDEEMLQEVCMGALLPVRDALETLSGRWKLPILISLVTGSKRFSSIARDLPGITDKMLSKELKEMELNKLVVRTVHSTFPPKVEYESTEYSKSLGHVIASLRDWGMLHRKKIMGKLPDFNQINL